MYIVHFLNGTSTKNDPIKFHKKLKKNTYQIVGKKTMLTSLTTVEIKTVKKIK